MKKVLSWILLHLFLLQAQETHHEPHLELKHHKVAHVRKHHHGKL
jgi:hypothetical protein